MGEDRTVESNLINVRECGCCARASGLVRLCTCPRDEWFNCGIVIVVSSECTEKEKALININLPCINWCYPNAIVQILKLLLY